MMMSRREIQALAADSSMRSNDFDLRKLGSASTTSSKFRGVMRQSWTGMWEAQISYANGAFDHLGLLKALNYLESVTGGSRKSDHRNWPSGIAERLAKLKRLLALARTKHEAGEYDDCVAQWKSIIIYRSQKFTSIERIA